MGTNAEISDIKYQEGAQSIVFSSHLNIGDKVSLVFFDGGAKMHLTIEDITLGTGRRDGIDTISARILHHQGFATDFFHNVHQISIYGSRYIEYPDGLTDGYLLWGVLTEQHIMEAYFEDTDGNGYVFRPVLESIKILE